MRRWFAPVLASLSLLATMAHSNPSYAEPPFRLKTQMGPPMAVPANGDLAGATIFLNRCVGGCMVRPGTDDAATDSSGLVSAASTLPEFTFPAGEWEDVVACVQEVYSPYNLHVVATRPVGGILYSEIMVGGSPSDIGQDAGVGGVALVSANCQPNPKGVAFAFTSAIDVFASEDGGSRVHGLCWIIAQETAHTFGLDHEYSYVDDNSSACNDPMTYRSDCGGQKFFRNRFAKCGEFGSARPGCGITNACSTSQNSHQMLTNVFGPGTSLTPPPTSVVTLPTPTQALGAVVAANVGSKRGIAKVELILNGYKWAELKGVAFGPMGQQNPASYTLPVPSNLPNSVVDVVVRAYDDLGTVTDSAPVTVTKGAACTTADTCLKGMKCEAGKCFWEAASGELGDACTYPQFCKSGTCSGTATQQICTQECIPGVSDSCPAEAGLTCLESSPGKGICFLKEEEAGCCSVGSSHAAWAPGALFALLLGVIVLRPRKRGR